VKNSEGSPETAAMLPGEMLRMMYAMAIMRYVIDSFHQMTGVLEQKLLQSKSFCRFFWVVL
jgi:hypothetical protein